MKLTDWALKHPIPITVITAGIVLFGFIAFAFLNREFMSPVVLPRVTVATPWTGVAANDVERDVTSVLENQFGSLNGLRDLYSESREGISIITLQFSEDIDTDDILEEVRAKVALASSQLPEDIDTDPVIDISGASALPVFKFAIFAPWNLDRISHFVEDELIPEIYKVKGVANVKMLGERRLLLQVTLDSQVLTTAGITPIEVYRVMKSRNRTLPSGLVKWNGGEWAFRVSDEYEDAEGIGNLIVGYVDSVPLRLSQIASISETYENTNERIRLKGRDALVVQVTKRDFGNAIQMSQEIQKRLEKIENESQGAYQFRILHDDADTIERSLTGVLNSAVTGIAIAIAMIWFFLRSWRYTLVVAVSLPVSIIITFACMKLAGQSINILTMAGITVSMGMVVDASIVVLENIHQRHLQVRNSLVAAREGAGQVSGAVIASITTSISVFAPMMFLTGVIGIIMKDLSLAIVLSLSASLFSALLLVPPLARRNLEHDDYHKTDKGHFMVFLKRLYENGLKRILKIKISFIIATLLLLIASFVIATMMGVSFIPSADYNELFISIEQPPGFTLDEGVELADRVEELIHSKVDEVLDVLFYVGMEDDLAGDARKRESLWGHLILTPAKQRKRSFRDIMNQLNEILPQAFPGTSITVLNGGFERMLALAVDGNGYRVELSSRSTEKLLVAADRVESLLAQDPDILGTGRDLSGDRPTVTASLDGELIGKLGVNALDAAFTARIMFEGVKIGQFRSAPSKNVDRGIFLVSDLEHTVPDARALSFLPIRTRSGEMTSFDSISSIQDEIGVSEIMHRDRSRTITVIGYARDENIRGVGKRLGLALEDSPLDKEVEWHIRGVGGLLVDSILDFALVLLISLFLVYAVMAIQFERFLQPLIIMASVPFCFIGVLISLAVFGSNLSIISFLGIVALAGIAVNNAIVQVDCINLLRMEGMDLHKAIITGAVSRLRPILMTSITTFFGVLPLSLARGAGARIYAPLGQAIAGGLMSSTLITLFLIPVLYLLIEQYRERSTDLEPDTGARKDIA